MTVNVDPFVIPIPQKILNDPELAPTFQYLWRFLYDMWQRTGGSVDLVQNVTYELNAEESRSTPEMYRLAASDNRNKAEFLTLDAYAPDSQKEIRRLQAQILTLQTQNTMLEKKLNKFIAEVNASA